MNCEWVRENLSAYIDDELDRQQASDLENHIASCVKCNAAYREMSHAWDMLDTWEEVAPPGSLRTDILRRIRYGQLRRWPVMLSAAAVVLIAVSVVLFYGTRAKEEPAVQMVRSEKVPAIPEQDLPDVEKEEIIANLHLLQDKDFLDSIETMKKIDYLPLMDEEKNENDKSSSLEVKAA